MKKLVLGLVVAVSVLFSGISVKAQTIAIPDYEKNGVYKQTKDDCVWATVDANYRYAEAYKLMDAVNAFRVENGMPALQTNDYCMQIAMQRALEFNVLADHSSPYNSVLGSESVGACGVMLGFTQTITFTCWESCTSLETIEDLMSSFREDSRHTLEAGNAIGVGWVNDSSVIIIYKKEAALKSTINTGLTDYCATMKVPVNKKWLTSNIFNWDSEHPVIIETSTNTEEQPEEEQQEVKQTEISKVSGVKLSKKRSGKNTKITIKFNKIKGCKYQIQVANNKKFKNAKKNSNSSNKKTVSVKYKGKKAYVRVRCYKKVNGKTVYGKWSTVKSIKTYK